MNESTITDLAVRDDFDDKVPRVRDVDLGRRLGMAQPANIRTTIERNIEFLSQLGVFTRRVQTSGKLGGRPATEYWLTEKQAFWLATQSGTEEGKRTALLLVEAFVAFRSMVVDRIPPFLRAEFGPWSKVWQTELMKELCTLKGEVFTGKHPRWCARTNSIIYECLLGREVYAELRAQNPKPARGRNHHQLITPEYREAFEKQLGVVTALAATSSSLADLEAQLRRVYQKKPLQLPLWAARRMPSLAKAQPTPRRRKLGRPA